MSDLVLLLPAQMRRIEPFFSRCAASPGAMIGGYRQRHGIENAFGRLKDWRRIAMRYAPMRPHLLLGHMHRRRSYLPGLFNAN